MTTTERHDQALARLLLAIGWVTERGTNVQKAFGRELADYSHAVALLSNEQAVDDLHATALELRVALAVLRQLRVAVWGVREHLTAEQLEAIPLLPRMGLDLALVDAQLADDGDVPRWAPPPRLTPDGDGFVFLDEFGDRWRLRLTHDRVCPFSIGLDAAGEEPLNGR